MTFPKVYEYSIKTATGTKIIKGSLGDHKWNRVHASKYLCDRCGVMCIVWSERKRINPDQYADINHFDLISTMSKCDDILMDTMCK